MCIVSCKPLNYSLTFWSTGMSPLRWIESLWTTWTPQCKLAALQNNICMEKNSKDYLQIMAPLTRFTKFINACGVPGGDWPYTYEPPDPNFDTNKPYLRSDHLAQSFISIVHWIYIRWISHYLYRSCQILRSTSKHEQFRKELKFCNDLFINKNINVS